MDILQKLSELKYQSLELGINEIWLCSNEKELAEEQKGYAINGITGELIKEWFGENYVVIGNDSMCGDPFIVKTDEENLPVYFMFHDDWESLDMVSKSFDDFIKILDLLKEEKEKDFSNKDFEELEKRILQISDGCNCYWRELIEGIKEDYL